MQHVDKGRAYVARSYVVLRKCTQQIAPAECPSHLADFGLGLYVPGCDLAGRFLFVRISSEEQSTAGMATYTSFTVACFAVLLYHIQVSCIVSYYLQYSI